MLYVSPSMIGVSQSFTAYETGASYCRIANPSQILDESIWKVTGLLTSKYLSIAVEDIASLIMLNCFLCEGVQLNFTSFLRYIL